MTRERGENLIGREGGFTLVELVTVVAIVGILAMIAVPGYRKYVLRSHRGAAKAAMVDAAQSMERYMTQNSRYNNPAGSTTCGVTPENPSGGRYALSCAANTDGITFLIQAVPQGGQADDQCGTLALTQAGARSASGTDPSGPCW